MVEKPEWARLYDWCDGTDPRCDVSHEKFPHMHHQDQVWLNHRNTGHTTNDNDPRNR